MRDFSAAKKSVEALMSLLDEIVRSPGSFLGDEPLTLALRSQGGLAAYSDPPRAILPMSLNHQKKCASQLHGDFFHLDQARRAAFRTLTAARLSPTVKKQTRQTAEERYAQIEEKYALVLQDLFLLQRAFDLRCQQAKNYARQAGPAVVERCLKEQREVEASLTLRQTQTHEGNIVYLGGRPR